MAKINSPRNSRRDNIIGSARPEESIPVDEAQNNNGEEGAAAAAEDLQDGPIIDNDARAIEVDDDIVAAGEKVVLKPG